MLQMRLEVTQSPKDPETLSGRGGVVLGLAGGNKESLTQSKLWRGIVRVEGTDPG